MRLLLGSETPESGTIYYDGHDISQVDVLEVRRQIGVVLQNAQIMAGSIYENIVGAGAAGLTSNDASGKQRDGGMRGYPKSNGVTHDAAPWRRYAVRRQRQRIIIARAIVRKPRILFFDEATSAL